MSLNIFMALTVYYLYDNMYLFVLCMQQRTGLKGREKEQMWKELLKVLRPAGQQLVGPTIVIPEQDDFDPDTYGKPVELVVEGEPLLSLIYMCIMSWSRVDMPL